MRCSLCSQDESLKETWGCTTPSDTPVWELGEDTYYSCPLNYITDDVANWYQEYEYSKEFGGTSWHLQSYAWVQAYRWYMQSYNGHVQKAQERSNANMNSIAAFDRHKHQGAEDG